MTTNKEKTADEYFGGTHLKQGAYGHYYPLYDAAINYLPEPSHTCPTIVDLGCGVGHLARILFDRGYEKYLGIDFASAVLEKARKQVPDAVFFRRDLNDLLQTATLMKNLNTFVILEVLEHLMNDETIVNWIPSGSLVILSVPNYDDPAHVRHFNSMDEVINRYKDLLDIKESTIIQMGSEKKIFLLKVYKH